MKKSEEIFEFLTVESWTLIKARKRASEALEGEEPEGVENDVVPHHQELTLRYLQHALGNQRHYIRKIL